MWHQMPPSKALPQVPKISLNYFVFWIWYESGEGVEMTVKDKMFYLLVYTMSQAPSTTLEWIFFI